MAAQVQQGSSQQNDPFCTRFSSGRALDSQKLAPVSEITCLRDTSSGNDVQKDEKSRSDWPSSTLWTALCNETNEFGTATWQRQRLRWQATQTETEMLKNPSTEILRRQHHHQRVCQKQNQNLPGTDMWCLFSSFDWFFAVIVFLLFRQIMFTPWICHCSQIYVFYICFLRILNTSISLNIQTKTK